MCQSADMNLIPTYEKFYFHTQHTYLGNEACLRVDVH